MGAENWAETTATVQFEKAVEFQLMELHDDFESMCNFKGGITGEKTEVTDRFSDLDGKEIEGRAQKITHENTDVERRWIHKPNRYSVHSLLDADDQMATEVPLDSPLAAAVARAVRRYRQSQWLKGFYSVAYRGKEGLDQVAFDSTQVLAADWNGSTFTGTPVGLTEAKLRWARWKARKNLLDPREPGNKLHMGICADDVDDLLQINSYISRDYNPDSQIRRPLTENAKQALQDGEATDWLGIHFVPMEFTNTKVFKDADTLALNGSGHRRNPIWIPSGVGGREWETITTERDRRTDLDGHPMQFSAYTCVRYSRIHEQKCFIIENA